MPRSGLSKRPATSTRGQPKLAPRTRSRDARIVRDLCGWFDVAHRDLPWRRSGPPGQRDPYHSLLSELMLQQTQVARVIEKFNLFIQRYPTLPDLASAPLDDILALWSGLGYYRRARLLHAAAQAIINDHAGIVPHDVASLRSIPGIGPYTAGAIASIAHGVPTSLVDGNVVRVLLRLDARPGRASDRATMDWTWKRADTLVQLAKRPGVLNEALMELGATVCTPKAPRCTDCPLARDCIARDLGKQDQIPSPKTKPARQSLAQTCVIIRDSTGRILMEERRAPGLWAGLWQPFTDPMSRASSSRAQPPIVDLGGLGLRRRASGIRLVDSFTFRTSHRDVAFSVYILDAPMNGSKAKEAIKTALTANVARRRWVTPDQLQGLALSNAHRKVLRSAGVDL